MIVSFLTQSSELDFFFFLSLFWSGMLGCADKGRRFLCRRWQLSFGPGREKNRSFKKTHCHIAHHRYQAAELNRNMRAGLWLPFLSLLGSCWCAPQQTCHPGDEFLGKRRFSFKKNDSAYSRTSEPPVRLCRCVGSKSCIVLLWNQEHVDFF